MTEFKIGQKVLVQNLKPYDGIPMEYAGKVFTILTNETGNPNWPYRIVEDKRWVWKKSHFISTGEISDPNVIFKLNKKGGL